ncbi:MAG: hypothetical protein K0R31_1357 [Clostridiales bacterium]|jgi:hypothetical protein|nr:hypothetical protein [Clostridiales bacterium]
MNILNESVKHIMFGSGVITEVKDHKILVQFQDEIGTKLFLFPEVFEKFMKALNPTVENDVLEQLRIKQEQLELKRKEKEREAAELKEKIEKVVPVKKKATRTIKK